jgi:hypothetical protein
MGLSFSDLNLLTLDEYVRFVERWVGSKDDEEGDRYATPEDIARILG